MWIAVVGRLSHESGRLVSGCVRVENHILGMEV